MIKKIKGFSDKWDIESKKIQLLIQVFNTFADKYDFNLVSTPTVELKEVFSKTLGTVSDIVQKEFFNLESRKGEEKIVLRPELTSSVIRACLESKKILNNKQPLNVYTFGNCFRYEKPQKGRYREFFQWSLEQILTNDENYLKIFSYLNLILDFFELKKIVTLKINFLSLKQQKKVREFFVKETLDFELCNLCKKRKNNNNIYRIFDCKICGELISKKINLPLFLSEEDKRKYKLIKTELNKILPNLNIVEAPSLTRGLDYYDGIVFELLFNSKKEWAKNVILAGGEYILSAFNEKQFSNSQKGIGFAIGIERFIIALEEINFFNSKNLFEFKKVSISLIDEKFKFNLLELCNELIKFDYFVFNNLKPITFSKSLQKNLEKNAQWMIYFGREFLENQKVLVKKLTIKGEEKIQFIVPIYKVIEILNDN